MAIEDDFAGRSTVSGLVFGDDWADSGAAGASDLDSGSDSASDSGSGDASGWFGCGAAAFGDLDRPGGLSHWVRFAKLCKWGVGSANLMSKLRAREY